MPNFRKKGQVTRRVSRLLKLSSKNRETAIKRKTKRWDKKAKKSGSSRSMASGIWDFLNTKIN